MRTNGLQQQGIVGTGSLSGIDGVGGSLESQLAQVMSGPGMDVAALGLKKGLDLRTQHITLVTALLNRERDSTQRIIDSMGT